MRDIVFWVRCFVLAIAGGLSGCTPSLYYWGDFEDGLYQRYVTEQQPQADAYLLQTIQAAEQNHLKAPPGAYADYGLVLFKRGDRDGAAAYFQREKLAFPESSALMDKLIEKVKANKTALAEKPAEPEKTTDITKASAGDKP